MCLIPMAMAASQNKSTCLALTSSIKSKNGFVTREEFGLASAATFNFLDRNGNNRVTKMEYTAGIPLPTLFLSLPLLAQSLYTARRVRLPFFV